MVQEIKIKQGKQLFQWGTHPTKENLPVHKRLSNPFSPPICMFYLNKWRQEKGWKPNTTHLVHTFLSHASQNRSSGKHHHPPHPLDSQIPTPKRSAITIGSPSCEAVHIRVLCFNQQVVVRRARISRLACPFNNVHCPKHSGKTQGPSTARGCELTGAGLPQLHRGPHLPGQDRSPCWLQG